MSLVLQPDIVRYGCTCGAFNAISKIFFCRHCLKIRCGYCLCHEVDSHYCATCLENLPSQEARLKKNRCATCYDCPSCFHTLSVRITSVQTPSADDPNKTVTRKFYYLSCAFCRWTTRDAGIPDQTAASGTWTERENPHSSRINGLLDYYKMIAMQERLEKERKKLVPRARTYMTLTDRLGISAESARKRAGLPPLTGGTMSQTSFTEVQPAEASEEVELLPEDIFVKPVDLMALTTMPQRLAEPNTQPSLVNQMVPSHKVLYIKRSQRCRVCEHNVSKPEFNPVSIKFKIQLSAYYHIPDVRVFTCEPLRLGSPSQLLLKLCNPTSYPTTVHFLPAGAGEEEAAAGEAAAAAAATGAGAGDTVPVSALRLLSVGGERATPANASVELPGCGVVLPQRDDAAEYDDSGDTHSYQDDPKVVVWRKGNKAMVKMAVTPQSGLVAQNVTIGFRLQYSFVNTIPGAAQDAKENQPVQLSVPVYIKIGKLVGNN